jgi:hypothetical protein
MIADALATALTVLGAAAGSLCAPARPGGALHRAGPARDREERMTPSFAAMLE